MVRLTAFRPRRRCRFTPPTMGPFRGWRPLVLTSIAVNTSSARLSVHREADSGPPPAHWTTYSTPPTGSGTFNISASGEILTVSLP